MVVGGRTTTENAHGDKATYYMTICKPRETIALERGLDSMSLQRGSRKGKDHFKSSQHPPSLTRRKGSVREKKGRKVEQRDPFQSNVIVTEVKPLGWDPAHAHANEFRIIRGATPLDPVEVGGFMFWQAGDIEHSMNSNQAAAWEGDGDLWARVGTTEKTSFNVTVIKRTEKTIEDPSSRAGGSKPSVSHQDTTILSLYLSGVSFSTSRDGGVEYHFQCSRRHLGACLYLWCSKKYRPPSHVCFYMPKSDWSRMVQKEREEYMRESLRDSGSSFGTGGGKGGKRKRQEIPSLAGQSFSGGSSSSSSSSFSFSSSFSSSSFSEESEEEVERKKRKW